MSFHLDETVMDRIVEIADNYRAHRDVEFSPMMPATRRANFEVLVRLTNLYASMVACELPLITVADLELLFRGVKHRTIEFTSNYAVQEAITELLGVLTARRALAERGESHGQNS